MNKIFFASCLLGTSAAISSCTKVASPSTFEYTIQSFEWSEGGTSGSSNYLYYNQHSLPEITDAVVSSGAVLGFVKTGTYYAALPFTETYSGYTSNYNYSYMKSEVIIIRKDSDLLTIPPAGSITIKIVILTEKHMHLLDGVDTQNYYEVEDALKL